MTFDIDNLDISALEARAKITKITKTDISSPETTTVVTSEQVNKTLTYIHKATGSKHTEDTVLVTCGMLQKGGTSKNMKPTSYFEIGDIKLTKNILNKACEENKITPRQLARAMANRIHFVAVTLSLPGNQAKNFSLKYSDATLEERYWASDFQTFNPNCPQRVKDWLVENYKSRFTKTN